MRFGGACADFGVLTVLTGLFLFLSLIPQPIIFWKKTSCFFTCDCFLVLELLPPAPGDRVTRASLPKVPSPSCSSALLLLLLLRPRELFLT